jgi:hypothetical protein
MRHFAWVPLRQSFAGTRRHGADPGPLPADSDCPSVGKSLTWLPKIPTANRQVFRIKMLAACPARPLGQVNFTPCRLPDTEVDAGRIDRDRGGEAEGIAPRFVTPVFAKRARER